MFIPLRKRGRGRKSKLGKKKTAKKGGKAKVSRPLRNAIKSVAKSQIETKYVGDYIVATRQITAGASVPANLYGMLPQLTQGLGDSQRVGDKIEPIGCRATWTVYFKSQAAIDFQDLQYNLLVLTAKSAKTAAALATLAPNTLLRLGNGTNTDPATGAYTQNQFIENINHLPVNTDQWTVLKHFKHRFVKGSYDINGPPVTAVNTTVIAPHPTCVTFRYSWKPPTLKFLTGADVFPSNHYPVYIHWISMNDGGAYAGGLYFGFRSEILYKDA